MGRPVEAIQRQPDNTKIARDRKRIEDRRGRKRAAKKVAAARKLLTLVYYGCATNTSARWPTARQREHLGRNTRAVVQLSDPRIPARSPT